MSTGGGIFRGIKSRFAKMFAADRAPKMRTTEYPDPVLSNRYTKVRLRAKQKRKPQKRLQRPPCEPWTMTYHHKLVSLYGRREADRLFKKYQDGDFDDLPF